MICDRSFITSWKAGDRKKRGSQIMRCQTKTEFWNAAEVSWQHWNSEKNNNTETSLADLSAVHIQEYIKKDICLCTDQITGWCISPYEHRLIQHVYVDTRDCSRGKSLRKSFHVSEWPV